jgi:hypothetical protein
VIPVLERCLGGYLQEGLSDLESKSECTTESDHSMECAELSDKPKTFAHFRFSLKKHFDLSSCIILKHNMNCQNFPLCPDFLMKEKK